MFLKKLFYWNKQPTLHTTHPPTPTPERERERERESHPPTPTPKRERRGNIAVFS